jgi:hypothetical protein
MLGLVGIHLNAHEEERNYCTVNPETGERINLQPWPVVGEVPATKTSPAKRIVYRPASEEDFKAILKAQGENHKAPLVGVLPPHIEKVKKAMYDKAVVDYNKLVGNASAPVAEQK